MHSKRQANIYGKIKPRLLVMYFVNGMQLLGTSIRLLILYMNTFLNDKQ